MAWNGWNPGPPLTKEYPCLGYRGSNGLAGEFFKHTISVTIQIVPDELADRRWKKPSPCLAPDVYSFAYSFGAAGEMVSLGLAVTTLALNHLSRTSCRFPGSSEIGLL